MYCTNISASPQDQSDERTKRTGSFASEVAFAGVQTLTVRPMKVCTQREALECGRCTYSPRCRQRTRIRLRIASITQPQKARVPSRSSQIGFGGCKVRRRPSRRMVRHKVHSRPEGAFASPRHWQYVSTDESIRTMWLTEEEQKVFLRKPR